MNRKESGSTFIGLNGDEPAIFSFRIKMHNSKRYKALTYEEKVGVYKWINSQVETLRSWAGEALEDASQQRASLTPQPAPEG